MKWEEMSWPQINELSKDLPVVLPLGAVEQHGPHLPLVTDTCQVSAIADRLDAQMGEDIVTLPVLWLGSSHHHLDFPGTLSLRPSLYTQVIQDLVRSVLKAGFRRIFILNGHGGNEVPVAQALGELSSIDEEARQALLTYSSWWHVGKPDPRAHGMATSAISHACEYETSLMLYLCDDLVDQRQAVEPKVALESPWLDGPKQVQEFRSFRAMTPTGNLGNPLEATADKGRSMIETVVKDIAAFLHEYATWPYPVKA